MINQRPVSPVEIQLLIENSEERLSEAQDEALLLLVAESLPSHITESDEGEEEEEVGRDILLLYRIADVGLPKYESYFLLITSVLSTLAKYSPLQILSQQVYLKG